MNAEAPKKSQFALGHSYLAIGTGFFVLAVLLGFVLKPLESQYFPVRFVRIQGAINFLDRSELEASLLPLLESGYWDLNLESIGHATEKLPWVASVQTQRVWPDTLVLKIEEHEPVARFGAESLISVRGIVFSPSKIEDFRTLPGIDGPRDKASELLAAFLIMQTDARALGLKLKELRIGERGSWSLQTEDSLLVELGRDTPVRQFKRFIHTLTLLDEQQIRSMVRVDLRYRNGYAVEWMRGTEPEWSSFLKRKDPRRSEPVQSI